MPASHTVSCPVIVLVGPTAIGKTALSFRIAERFQCEIVSMDSMQVYRHMDIGTAKPSREERQRVAHHLVDIVFPDDRYDAARFVDDSLEAIRAIEGRNRAVLLTGGTGLYLKALLEGLFTALPADPVVRENLKQRLAEEGREALHAELTGVDPEAGRRIHRNDTQRLLRGLEIFQVSGRSWSELLSEQKAAGGPTVRFKRIVQVGLTCERKALYKRIAERSHLMVRQGMVEEVEHLRAMGYSPKLASMQSIGYRHANCLISGQWDMQTMMDQLILDTRRYAKRQMTWFGNNDMIRWFNRDDYRGVLDDIADTLSL